MLAVQLVALPTDRAGVNLVSGTFHIVDGRVPTNNDLKGRLQGVHLSRLGMLTAEANAYPGSSMQLWLTEDVGAASGDAPSTPGTQRCPACVRVCPVMCSPPPCYCASTSFVALCRFCVRAAASTLLFCVNPFPTSS